MCDVLLACCLFVNWSTGLAFSFSSRGPKVHNSHAHSPKFGVREPADMCSAGVEIV